MDDRGIGGAPLERCIDSTWHRSRSTRCKLPAGHTGPHMHEVILDRPDDDGLPYPGGIAENRIRSIPYPVGRGGFAYPIIQPAAAAPMTRRRRFRLWREDVALRWRTRSALWVAPWLYDGEDD